MSTPTKTPAIDTTEVRKASFWIAQICIIIATILGVYLAANQGFKQAMAFDEIRSDKANYYMRASLRSEITNNIGVVREYVAKVRKSDGLSVRKSPLSLQLFFWENMKFSPSTLETPTEFLTANVEFLRVVNATYGELSTSGITTEIGLKRLEDAIQKVEEGLLPKLDASIARLRSSLEKRDVGLDS